MLDGRRLFEAYHIPFIEAGHHHCHEGWVQINCPFCAAGRGDGWHLGFSLEYGLFNCWRCGRLRTSEVLMAICRLSNPGELRSIYADYQTGRRRALKPAGNRPTNAPPPRNLGPLQAPHRRYLRQRGFDVRTVVKTWGLLGCGPLAGDWAWRLVIPIFAEDGRVLAYQGRSLGNGRPKYRLTDKGQCADDPASIVYGLHAATPARVLIVEGVTGVWRLGRGTVATLGIDWKVPQAEQLARFEHRFVLFDPEPVAQQRAEELAWFLSQYPGTTEVISGFRTDPGDFSPQQAARVRADLGFSEEVLP